MHNVFLCSIDETESAFHITVDLSPAQGELGLDPEIAQYLVAHTAEAQGVTFDRRHGGRLTI